MDRSTLLTLLSQHKAINTEEDNMLQETIVFVKKYENCFDRELQIGHVTGSAWILNPERTHVLLMHHKKLDRWFQPGGHCDGDPDVQAVAKKEAWEETAQEVTADGNGIFDVDVHIIPERKGEPAHKHYDIRFLFSAPMLSEDLDKNEEANAVKWIKLSEVHRFNNSESIMRMVGKIACLK